MSNIPLTPIERKGFPLFKVFTTLYPDQGGVTARMYMEGYSPVCFEQYLRNVVSMGDNEKLIGRIEEAVEYVRSLGESMIEITYYDLLVEFLNERTNGEV